MNRVDLQGRCFVTHLDDLDYRAQGLCSWATYIDRAAGSDALSMTAMVFSKGRSEPIGFAAGDQVLYAFAGQASLLIGNQTFPLQAKTGAYLYPGEKFSIVNENKEPLQLLVGVCPESEQLIFGGATGTFNTDQAARLVYSDRQTSQATGDRFFKLLVGPAVGSHQVTQFIGMIPQSRAPSHFHTYEETICILSGEGFMWAGDQKAAVRPGSLIYLPRKQSHCLECTSPEGMTLAGLFYPAGSPAVRYEDE